MVEYGIEPSSLFGSTLQGIQPKFYVLGLMYTLNQRVNFRAQWATDSNEPVSDPALTLTSSDTICCFKERIVLSGRRPCSLCRTDPTRGPSKWKWRRRPTSRYAQATKLEACAARADRSPRPWRRISEGSTE